MEFKKNFIEDYKKLLGDELDLFLEFLQKPLRKSIRINTIKKPVKEILPTIKDWKPKVVGWCKEGFYVEAKGVGNEPGHCLGHYYVQEAASMIPPVVLEPEGFVLDLCASPGSKTTQMATYDCTVFANDKMRRMAPLQHNVQRCGATNVILTRQDGTCYKSNFLFDRVLVDAPCTGVGAIRKKYEIAKMWSRPAINQLVGVQRRLIIRGFDLLKPGGVMVYSTCTLSPEENEGIVDYLLRNRDAEIGKICLPIKRSDPVLEWRGEKYGEGVSKTLRIYPQDNDTEGFFVAKVMKRG
jgi:NOL1/NOP2/sun family putative RNA methylase